MIALGWTLRGAEPAGLFAVAAPGCAVVAAPACEAETARGRLQLQVRCARSLPSFLPLSAECGVNVDEALAHTQRRNREIVAQLAAVADRVQVTLSVAYGSPDLSGDGRAGRAWLLARAAGRAEAQAKITAAAVELRAMLEDRWPVVVTSRLRSVRADALVERAHAERLIADAAKRLAGSVALRGASVTVTGPWPAFSFCQAMEQAA
jgi:hypothetical protein